MNLKSLHLSRMLQHTLTTHRSCVCVCVCREKAPGQRECDDAIEVLNGCIREVDQASLAAISQQLTPREDISMEVRFPEPQLHLSLRVCVRALTPCVVLQALHEQMAASVHEISHLIEPVALAARSEASQLGHKVNVSNHWRRWGGCSGCELMNHAMSRSRYLRWRPTLSL